MYAVIETGGKQYKVQVGDRVRIEKLENDVDEKVVFDKVFLLADGDDVTIGRPFIDGAKVEANVVAQDKAKKVIVYKYKAKKNIRKKQGHRQPYTEVIIESIN